MQNMPMTFRSQVPDINSQNYLPYISNNFSSENVTSENIPRKIFFYILITLLLENISKL